MEFRYHCLWCPPSELVLHPVFIGADRAYPVRCAQGHQAVLLLGNAPYSLLFERGLSRLVAGDTRDAVLDAYTSFEMFCAEYPIRLRHAAAPAALATIRHDFREVTKTSDRALAVAYASYGMITHRAVRSLPKLTEIRNRATHGGVRPSYEEALKLCRWVSSELEALNEAISPLQHGAYLAAERLDRLAECSERFGAAPVVEQSFNSVLDAYGWLPGLTGVFGRTSIDDQLEALKRGPVESFWVQPVMPIKIMAVEKSL